MCGRYSETRSVEYLMKRFGVKAPIADIKPRYNIAPSQDAPVIINQDEKRLELFRWGLIPSWAKDAGIGNKMINARAETLQEKPAFKRLLQKKRCLVIADGFYEWVKSSGSGKTPMRIRLKSDEPFAFAGLWDVWKDADGKETESFTIVTSEPNNLISQIHNRMPVILKREYEDPWLDPDLGIPEIIEMTKPYPGDELEYYAVSKVVNSPRNDVTECALPI